MNIKEIIVSRIQMFFFLVAMILFAQMVLGSAFEPERVIHYSDLSGTFLLAFFCVLPSVVVCSKKEPDLKGLIIRESIQFVLVEAIVVGWAIIGMENSPQKVTNLISVAIAAAVIYILALLIEWYKQRIESKKMTQLLIEFQKNQ